jgi:hypothetical protein
MRRLLQEMLKRDIGAAVIDAPLTQQLALSDGTARLHLAQCNFVLCPIVELPKQYGCLESR